MFCSEKRAQNSDAVLKKFRPRVTINVNSDESNRLSLTSATNKTNPLLKPNSQDIRFSEASTIDSSSSLRASVPSQHHSESNQADPFTYR